MNVESVFGYMFTERFRIATQLIEHASLTFLSVSLAAIIAIPLGIFISQYKKWSAPILGFSGILQTIPSLALLGILIPIMGIGYVPALFALFLYAIMPILRNTYTGINGIDQQLKEAAKAMGMSKAQSLLKVEIPLAMPVIIAGLRTAAVINVGVATLAAYIGAGGLGEFIFGGISLNNSSMMLAGAIPAALLALALDALFSVFQHLSATTLKSIIRWVPILLIIPTGYLSNNIVQHHFNKKVGLQTHKVNFLAGFTPEFIGRSDGYPGLIHIYKLNLKHVVINDAIMYQAIYEKKLDLISGYSTDGRLKTYNLVALKDDRHIFPPYYAAPIIRESVLKTNPEIRTILNRLKGKITDSLMTDMNYRVDYLHQAPEKVATDFLKSIGLYHSPQVVEGPIITIGAKIFGEQQILVNIYSSLIRGYTACDTRLKLNLGGTEIVFSALLNGSIDLYPEYTGTGLLVILKPDPKVSNSLFTDRDKLYQFVKVEFRKKYQLEWLDPHGFNNAYALMMRKAQAESMSIDKISDLKRFSEPE